MSTESKRQGKEMIRVIWHGNSKSNDFIFNSLFARSYEKFLGNKRRDVVSEYGGGQFIVITTQDDDKQCYQIALFREEIDTLPEEQQRMLRKDLASPAEKGHVAVSIG